MQASLLMNTTMVGLAILTVIILLALAGGAGPGRNESVHRCSIRDGCGSFGPTTYPARNILFLDRFRSAARMLCCESRRPIPVRKGTYRRVSESCRD